MADMSYQVFVALDATALEGGRIYLGEPNTDPETTPIDVFWDAGLTVLASQPLLTSGGVIVRDGTPADVYADQDAYSIRVRDRSGAVVWYKSTTGGDEVSRLTFPIPRGPAGADSTIPGPANNTYTSYAALQASDPARKYAYLSGDTDTPPRPDGPYSNTTGQVGQWTAQPAAGIAATGGPAAPPLTGRTMQRYVDGDLPPLWFGIIGDGSANDNAGVGYALEFAAELTQAPEPYSPANLTAARIAQSLDMRGKRIRVTQPRTIPNRKVDRTNGYLELANAAYVIDGDFTLFVPDTSPVAGGQPNAEFIGFSNTLFFNSNAANTASCFDERFLRMRFNRCQWWQQRILNTATAFAQEWQFRDCMARNWPTGQAWFKAAGGYAVRSFGSKWQNGGGNVFEMNSADAGVVDCSHYGFTVESTAGHFLRYGQIQGGGLFGGYSEKNGAALVNTTTLAGGRNRGFAIIGVQSDPIASRRTDTNAYEFILGLGGAAIISCHSTGNMIDNRLCAVQDVSAIGNALLDPVNNKLFALELNAVDNIIPDQSGGYGVKLTARFNVVTPVDGVETFTVCLPPPVRGITRITIANPLSATFSVRPSWSADGSRFRGGQPDTAIIMPANSQRQFEVATSGTWVPL